MGRNNADFNDGREYYTKAELEERAKPTKKEQDLIEDSFARAEMEEGK